jgi:hypothetical protein
VATTIETLLSYCKSIAIATVTPGMLHLIPEDTMTKCCCGEPSHHEDPMAT